MLLAFKALNIDEKEKMQVQLSDNLMTPISMDMFDDVIKCFWNGSGFFVNLITQFALDDAKFMVTPDVCDNFPKTIKRIKKTYELHFSEFGEIFDRKKCGPCFR